MGFSGLKGLGLMGFRASQTFVMDYRKFLRRGLYKLRAYSGALAGC